MNKNSLTIQKIELEPFIEILMDLWEKGVDFIDMRVGDDDNKIALSFKKEYMSEEARDEYDFSKDIPPTDIKDLDINDII
jgi:hypothetical protein